MLKTWIIDFWSDAIEPWWGLGLFWSTSHTTWSFSSEAVSQLPVWTRCFFVGGSREHGPVPASAFSRTSGLDPAVCGSTTWVVSMKWSSAFGERPRPCFMTPPPGDHL